MKSTEYSTENPVQASSSASNPANKHFLNIPASIAKLQIPSSHKLIYGELHSISLWHRKLGRRSFDITIGRLSQRCGTSTATTARALAKLRSMKLIFYVRSRYSLHFKIIEDAADTALPPPVIEETILEPAIYDEIDNSIGNNELSTFQYYQNDIQIQEYDFLLHKEVVDNSAAEEMETSTTDDVDEDSNLCLEDDLGKSLLYTKPNLIHRIQLIIFHWFSSQTTPKIAAANRKLVYRFAFFCGLDELERVINAAEDSGIQNSGGYVSQSLRNGISAALN